MKTIAVLGASGFVGNALVERLLRQRDVNVRACIHSTGRAARLARLGINLHRLDLSDQCQVDTVVKGCTHVVNCVLGDLAMMLPGLQNTLEACRAAGVERYVHLSSVTVYGDPPPPDSETEDAYPRPERGTYGWVKLEQDKLVAKAHEQGLSCVVLCPPPVTGPYSWHLLRYLAAIRAGTFALVEEGTLPVNFVDVENLVHAIELGLSCETADAKRMFITDVQPVTWREVAESLAPLADRVPPLPSISRDKAAEFMRGPKKPRRSPFRSAKHLASEEVRSVLRKDPLLDSLERIVRGAFPQAVRTRVRHILRGRESRPPGVTADADIATLGRDKSADPDAGLLQLQLRGVRHSCERARQVIGYEPQLTFEASMDRFRRWYAKLYGWNGPSWDLLRRLWRPA